MESCGARNFSLSPSPMDMIRRRFKSLTALPLLLSLAALDAAEARKFNILHIHATTLHATATINVAAPKC